MFEFLAGYFLASGSSRKTPETDDQKSFNAIATVVLLVSMCATLWLSVYMLEHGMSGLLDLMLSLTPGRTFWYTSTIVAGLTGGLAFVGVPVAGILFRMTIMSMAIGAGFSLNIV